MPSAMVLSVTGPVRSTLRVTAAVVCPNSELTSEAPAATPLEGADSEGDRAPTAYDTTYPTPIPISPPSTPISALSVTIWPTPRRRVEPRARRVPISPTRFCTDDSVSSTAIAKVDSSTMTVSAPPRRCASCFASCRLPVTVSATSLLVTTVAPGSACLIAAATSAVLEASVTLTRISLTRASFDASDCRVARLK